MQFLIDTHALIWFILDNPKLSRKAKDMIEDKTNKRFVSTVCVWEIAIKMSIGKLNMGGTFEQLFPEQLTINDMQLLPITTDHLYRIIDLPFHHRDPFDRLMIAQSIVESIPIISRDSAFDAYPIERLW